MPEGVGWPLALHRPHAGAWQMPTVRLAGEEAEGEGGGRRSHQTDVAKRCCGMR